MLAKKDYDAQRAEECFTRLLQLMDAPGGMVNGAPTIGLETVKVHAMLAIAHALEEIAGDLAGLHVIAEEIRHNGLGCKDWSKA